YIESILVATSKELKQRAVTKTELISIAENLYQIKCKSLLRESRFHTDALETPYSYFLSQKKCNAILHAEIKALIIRRDLLNHGLGSYGMNGGG
ncbi:MAG: hypothetical protein P8P74_03100, partial [Crocinitomicaceae bacterium]|nr:hypothetical protein [Crocinitomicaceae bacterium]